VPENFSECCDIIQPALPNSVPHLMNFQETVASRFPKLKAMLLECACGTTLLKVTHCVVHI